MNGAYQHKVAWPATVIRTKLDIKYCEMRMNENWSRNVILRVIVTLTAVLTYFHKMSINFLCCNNQ